MYLPSNTAFRAAPMQLAPASLPVHKGRTAYRCFLPDLAGFTAGQSHRTSTIDTTCTDQDPTRPTLGQEFHPAIADCEFKAPLLPRATRRD